MIEVKVQNIVASTAFPDANAPIPTLSKSCA